MPKSPEEFNPSDEQYKKAEDLPEEHQEEFTNVPKEMGSGFVKKEAMEEYEKAESRAELAEKSRTLLEKALGRHYKALDILHTDGAIKNNEIDEKIGKEEAKKEREERDLYVNNLMKSARHLDTMGESEKNKLLSEILEVFSVEELVNNVRHMYHENPAYQARSALRVLVELAEAGDKGAMKGLVDLTARGESYHATKSAIVIEFAHRGDDVAKQAIIGILRNIPEDDFTVIEDVVKSLIKIGGEDVTEALVKYAEKICAYDTALRDRAFPLIDYLRDKEGAHVTKAFRYMHKRYLGFDVDQHVLDALRCRGVEI